MDITDRRNTIRTAQSGRVWNTIAPDERLAILAGLIQKIALQMGSKKIPEDMSESTAALDESLSQNLGFLTENEVTLAFRWAPLGEVCEVPKGLTPANLYAAVKAFAYCEDRQIVRRQRWVSNGGNIDPDTPRKNFEALKDAAQQRWLNFIATGHVLGTEEPRPVNRGKCVKDIVGQAIYAKVSSLVYQWLCDMCILDAQDWEYIAPDVTDENRRNALRLEAAFTLIRNHNIDFLFEVQLTQYEY